MEYSCTVQGTTLRYSIVGEELRAEDRGGLKLSLSLVGGRIEEKERKVRSRWGNVGWVGIVLGPFTLAMVGYKEGLQGILHLGVWGVIHVLLFVAGVFLVIRFRRPLVGLEFAREDSGICIWCDPRTKERYRKFIEEVQSLTRRPENNARDVT
jgi:hypothetical protein